MNIELRNVKLTKSLSEETPCYTATVFVDGKPAVDVSNRGRGGADIQRARPGWQVETLDRHLAENMPALSMAQHGMSDIPCNLELWCHREVWEAEGRKAFGRTLKSRVVFVCDGSLRELRARGLKKIDQRCLDQFAKQFPGEVALNLMPFEEAWAIAKPLMMRE